MMIIGVDYHPSFQTIAFLMEETGECGEPELNHCDGEAGRRHCAQVLFNMQLVKTKPGSNGGRAGSNTELKGPLVRYSVDFAVSPQDLTLENSADGARHGNIEVRIVAYDPDGALLNSFRKKSRIVPDPKAYQEVMQVGIADAS